MQGMGGMRSLPKQEALYANLPLPLQLKSGYAGQPLYSSKQSAFSFQLEGQSLASFASLGDWHFVTVLTLVCSAIALQKIANFSSARYPGRPEQI